ncbi:MAG: hypothetical protein IB618_02470 [Candidatus Pacearchaeota archaeon]|nr:MAG: hypothetical protein IB618_02470 [Candidatus Pacearchaeota archaeon]
MPKISKGDFSWIEYVCKNLFRVCYLINQINKGSHIFSYKTLIKNSNKKDKELVNLLLKLKKSDWDKKLFISNLPKLIKLVDKISKNPT